MSNRNNKFFSLLFTAATALIAANGVFAEANASNDQATTKAGTPVQGSSILNGLSATADFTTNYVWRGVSQTQNRPAAQLAINYSQSWGFYAGLWGSNVDFLDVKGRTATFELNIYGGWKYNFAQLDDLGVDIGLLRYYYPNTTGINWTEYYAGLNYKIFEFYVYWSPNTFDLDRGIYYSGGISYDIPSNWLFGIKGLSVGAHVGYYDLDDNAGNSYWDWKLSLSKTITDHFTASIDYTDTNEKFATGDHSLDDHKVVFTLSASIPKG